MDSKIETLLLKIRKGTDAIKNIKNLNDVVSVLPNWSVKPVSVFVPMNHGLSSAFAKEHGIANTVRIWNSDKVSVEVEDAEALYAAHKILSGLVTNCIPAEVKRDEVFITSVGEVREVGNEYYKGLEFDYSALFGSRGVEVTAPNGSVFELGKEPGYKSVTFYKLIPWLKENGLVESVCEALGLEKYRSPKEQKEHEFNKRYVSAEEMKPVVEVVDNVTAEYHDDFVALIKRSLESSWEGLKAAADEYNAKNTRKRTVEDKEHYVNRLLAPTVKSVEDNWKYKLLSKLAIPIVDKGNLKKVEVLNVRLAGAVNSTLFVEFEDGSKFFVETSVEYAVSVNGTYFARYPLRFKDVVFADGSEMKNPSEEKIVKEFVNK